MLKRKLITLALLSAFALFEIPNAQALTEGVTIINLTPGTDPLKVLSSNISGNQVQWAFGPYSQNNTVNYKFSFDSLQASGTQSVTIQDAYNSLGKCTIETKVTYISEEFY